LTALIDLRKVHEALLWLKENNALYRTIRAYSLEDLNGIPESRLAARAVGVDTSPEIPDGAILEKLTNSTKSELVEHFSVQPLITTVPEDLMDDFMNNKILILTSFSSKS